MFCEVHSEIFLKSILIFVNRIIFHVPLLYLFLGKNGFKCHTMSESHQRQLLLLAEDVDKYMDTFSK